MRGNLKSIILIVFFGLLLPLPKTFTPKTIKVSEVQSGVVPVVRKTESIGSVEMNLKQRQCNLNAPEFLLQAMDDLNYSCEIKSTAIFIAEKESTFRPYVVNPFGYIGLFQYSKETFYRNCAGNIYNYEDQIRCSLNLISRGEANNLWYSWW